MNTKDLILKTVRKKGKVKTSEIVKLTGLTRQGVAKHLRELTYEGKLNKKGSTRNALYLPYSKHAKDTVSPAFSRRFQTKGLNEDQIFKTVVQTLGLHKLLSKPTFQIAKYAFTEMLNNVIDHSHSLMVNIRVGCEKGTFGFQISDRGVGAFESMKRKFRFKNHAEAATHLLKGKQTIDPKHHSGQGIFFTSKIADLFRLESAKLCLIIDNLDMKDVFLEPNNKMIKGTSVYFKLKQRSRKSLKELFDEYSNADFEFDKTVVNIRLVSIPGGYVSRSEAKRILFGLEKFKRIVMDFKEVTAVGQGFADEVFRVFRSAHPDIQIEPIHMSDTVAFTVSQAQRVYNSQS